MFTNHIFYVCILYPTLHVALYCTGLIHEAHYYCYLVLINCLTIHILTYTQILTTLLHYTTALHYCTTLLHPILGGTVDVLTLDGMVSMKVPTGSQPNETLMLRNKGIRVVNSATRRYVVIL